MTSSDVRMSALTCRCASSDPWNLAEQVGTSAQVISKESFLDSLFEVVDVWTLNIDVAEYLSFLQILFERITNQMIANCKTCILGDCDNGTELWQQDPEELVRHLEECLKLKEAYQEHYRLTKDKLLTMPKGKQFDFSETQIFGKFDLFCRRIIKLIDMFSTMQQFHALAEHKLEGMEPLLVVFHQIIAQFKDKGHDLLDFTNSKVCAAPPSLLVCASLTRGAAV